MPLPRQGIFLCGVTAIAALLFGLPAPAGSSGQEQGAVEDAPAEGEAAQDGVSPVWVASTRLDRLGRIMAPVYVNSQGPFAFVVDTGASRSAIAPRLVDALALEAESGAGMTLRGITGTEQVPTIRVERLEFAHVTLTDQQLPVVRPGIFANADGILGVDGLADSCVHADFRQQTISIDRGACPRLKRGWLRAPAQLRFGRLFTVQGRVGRVPVRVIVDTGAERTLGNAALRERLERQRREDEDGYRADVMGATRQIMPGDVLMAPVIHIAEMEVTSALVTFGDFEVFGLWGLDRKPALLLGMDVIGVADAIMIDYGRGELRLLPAAPALALRPGSKIPGSRLR